MKKPVTLCTATLLAPVFLQAAVITLYDGEQATFAEDLAAFDAVQDLGDGTNDGVENVAAPTAFGTGDAMRMYDFNTADKPELQGEFASSLTGAYRIDFQSLNQSSNSSASAIRFRMANSGKSIASQDQVAFSFSWQADGKIHMTYSGEADGDTSDVDSLRSSALTGVHSFSIVGNNAVSGTYAYTLFGESRTLDAQHYDVFIDGVLFNSGSGTDFANGMQYTLEYSSADYDPSLGIQRFGLLGSSNSDVDPDIQFDNIVLRTGSSISEIHVSNSVQLVTAINNLSPGDTIVLADGTYSHDGLTVDTVQGSETIPVLIKSENTGGAHWNGYLRIYDSTYITFDGVVFDFPAKRYSTENVILRNSEHCRLTRCTFDLDESGLTLYDLRYWLVLESGRYNTVDYCLFKDKITKFPTVKIIYDEYRPSLHHNHFDGRVSSGGLNGYETLQLGSGSSGHKFESMSATIDYNLFEECDGEAEIISVKTSGNYLRFNTFRECCGQLVLRIADNCQVYNNYFLNPSFKTGVGGVRIHGSNNEVYNNYFERLTDEAIETRFGDTDTSSGTEEVSYRQSKDNLVAFNTMFNCRKEVLDFGIGSTDYPLPPDGWNILNNLFVIKDTKLIDGEGDVDTFYQNNIADEIWNSGISDMGRTLTTEQMWVTYHYLEECSDSIWRQRDIANGRDHATPLFLAYQKDLDHQPRDSTPDIGADEYRSYTATYHPLTSSDVGPFAY